MPLVSILIPVYNREALVVRAVEAALAQTIADIEVVVVDNCSTDNTYAVVETIAKRDARVKLFRNETNIGPVKNWLACANYATAPYAKLLFSDDLIAPNFVERTLPALINPECGLVYSYAVVGREEWKGVEQYRAFRGNTNFAREYFLRSTTYIEHFTPVSPGAALLRTADLRKNLLTELPGIPDYDFNRTGAGVDWLIYTLTALAYPYVTYVDEPLTFFFAHDNSISGANENNLVPEGYALARQWLKHVVKGL
ncbi:glycosyltransferase family 2 protein [Roseateles koreensis]|uniref:Glycosyltransferase family 2 protein n=1 Tax=Roseateles koreensis TaxID=2987526 RepID=A0ABT5KX01_9BURK|nr:glycosyltransferase family 2 protein [Roseateles koreensis]MDC8786920.1 glycosyltransferase family 2 protein [Roseateles koreensis]